MFQWGEHSPICATVTHQTVNCMVISLHALSSWFISLPPILPLTMNKHIVVYMPSESEGLGSLAHRSGGQSSVAMLLPSSIHALSVHVSKTVTMHVVHGVIQFWSHHRLAVLAN